jgi:hypothetical protein
MRKLASIQTVKEVSPILGADNIELTTILGWKCITKKGEFKVGDLAVYCEIDSILPEREPFMFLATKKFRIKTWKLNKFGVVSQGILFPLFVLPEGKYKEDQDVTDILGVTKYEPEETDPAVMEVKEPKNKAILFIHKKMMRYELYRKAYLNLFGVKKEKAFPEFISKTDETRIQNLSNLFENEWKGTGGWDVTEKVEGQSATYFSRKTEPKWYEFWKKTSRQFGVCSRSIWLKTKHSCNWWNIAIKNNIEEKLLKVPFDIAIQGEIAGPGIQGNIYKFPELRFFVFNVKNLETGEMYNYEQITAFCMYYGFEQVPLVARNFYLPETLDEVVNYSNGKSLLYDTLREGVVIRKGDISFKAVSPEYLLKHGK